MFQKSMFFSHSHIICYFYCFVPLHSLSNVLRWSEKSTLLCSTGFCIWILFCTNFRPCILHQERVEDRSNYRRILNSSSVTCKLKLWRSLQCICVSINLEALLFHAAFPVPYVYPTWFHGGTLMSGTLLMVIVAFWAKKPKNHMLWPWYK